MTDIKNIAKGKTGAKSKLSLKKETVRDLSPGRDRDVRGGARGGPARCTYHNTGCLSAGCDGGE